MGPVDSGGKKKQKSGDRRHRWNPSGWEDGVVNAEIKRAAPVPRNQPINLVPLGMKLTFLENVKQV